MKVEEKSNEITAVPKLLDLLRLEGCVVTLDAMGCQRDIAKRIVGRKADHVLPWNVQMCKCANGRIPVASARAGRAPMELALAIEAFTLSHLHTCTLREIWQTGRIDWFEDKVKWEGLKSVAMVEATADALKDSALVLRD